jgi:hypothetical protein
MSSPSSADIRTFVAALITFTTSLTVVVIVAGTIGGVGAVQVLVGSVVVVVMLARLVLARSPRRRC